MSILKTCENCLFSSGHYPPFKMVCRDCHYAQNDKDDPDTCFQAKEHLIREDERNEIITDLEFEIQNFNEVRDSNVIDFIYDFVKELKEK